MLVLHLSLTPLAGAPIRICQALRLTGIDARCAVLSSDGGDYAKRAFDQDLVWSSDREQIIELADRCDVLHLHNYLGLDSSEFAPLDFRKLWEQGKPLLRQFHSAPEFIARFCKTSVQEVLACPISKLVIAQFHERYYPDARVMPNIVLPASMAVASPPPDGPLRVGYAPSRFNSARSSRWDTKGYHETIRVLRRFSRTARARGERVEIDVIEQVPHRECLARKARCHIVIDDLVTGSYHLNTLESLASGSVCLTYMDRATQQAVFDLTGRSDFPALSVGLEDAEVVLLDLAGNRPLVEAAGQHARTWMSRHWAPKEMARHFVDAYAHVTAHPGTPFPRRGDSAQMVQDWMNVRLHDLVWANRQQRWPRVLPDWLRHLRGSAGKALRGVGLG